MNSNHGHVRRYSSETIRINGLHGSTMQGNHVRTKNFVISLVVFIPLLLTLCSLGGNLMLSVLLVLVLAPLGYLFVKFF
jgi:hypothetical protein